MIRFEDVKPTRREPKTKAPATNTTTPATNKKTANRRDPDAFNAYQREYMRKRRMKAKGSSKPSPDDCDLDGAMDYADPD